MPAPTMSLACATWICTAMKAPDDSPETELCGELGAEPGQRLGRRSRRKAERGGRKERRRGADGDGEK